jgi:hypothetical protein
MKCAAVFLLISLALPSELSAVLRPRFPVKPTPPFRDDVIVIGNDMDFRKAGPVTALR